MRVALLLHQDPRGQVGGGETDSLHLANAAARGGHETLVIAPGDGRGEALRQETSRGVTFAALHRDALVPPSQRLRLRASYDNPRALGRIAALLDAFRPDRLIVQHLLSTSARIVFWAESRGVPITATLHDYWAFCHRIDWRLPDGTDCPGAQSGWRCRGCGKDAYNRWPGSLLQPLQGAAMIERNTVLRRAYRLCRAIFVPSRAVLEAHRANGFHESRLVYRPYGLPPALRVDRAELGKPLRVGYLGRLAPEKGVETLIAAARAGHDFSLTIWGAGAAEYESRLREMAVGAPVTLAGSFAREQLDETLANLDVVAVPSRWRENLPLVALEAAQRGVPVLAAANGGLRETPELCGARLVEPNEPQAWAAALSVLTDPERWQMLRAQMRYDRRVEDDLAAHLEAGGAA
jgi:glycosyltransferase involved in cell wall biosynthesis